MPALLDFLRSLAKPNAANPSLRSVLAGQTGGTPPRTRGHGRARIVRIVRSANAAATRERLQAEHEAGVVHLQCWPCRERAHRPDDAA